jgi:hypothetical protein
MAQSYKDLTRGILEAGLLIVFGSLKIHNSAVNHRLLIDHMVVV